MVFDITRKSDLNNIVFTIDGKLEREMTIKTLKEISSMIFDKKMNNEEIKFEVTCKDAEFEKDKVRLEKTLQDILKDEELFSMYKDYKTSQENEK